MMAGFSKNTMPKASGPMPSGQHHKVENPVVGSVLIVLGANVIQLLFSIMAIAEGSTVRGAIIYHGILSAIVLAAYLAHWNWRRKQKPRA